jgi:hypothetical protein
MLSLAEIETAVDALPRSEQWKLYRHLRDRLNPSAAGCDELPVVPATGRPITQAEIDGVCEIN